MIGRQYVADLSKGSKIIIGEGESDRNFLEAFCTANAIPGFIYAFTGMHTTYPYSPSGNTEFVRYLPVLESLTGFQNITDVILMCDAGDSAAQTLTDLQRQIRDANRKIGRRVFDENSTANAVSNAGPLRLHVLIIPLGRNGGLETLCVDVARDRQNAIENNKGTTIEGWVDTFANSACVNWTTEKRDKLRLQAFLSAAWRSKPDGHFSQLFGLTKGHYIPLTGAAFNDIRNFLNQVAAL